MEKITLEDAVKAIEDSFPIIEKPFMEKLINIKYENELILNRLMNIQFENEVLLNERLKKEHKRDDDDDSKRWGELLMKERERLTEDSDHKMKAFVDCSSLNLSSF